MTPLLRVEDLRVSFASASGVIEAVRGVSFDLGREKLGLVGESGSGKSTVARELLRLVPKPGIVSAQQLDLDGIDLQTLSETKMRRLRGRRISMILQDPRFSLNPVMRVGRQIVESRRAHFDDSVADARCHALGMLDSVGIRDPVRVFDAYAHELSGGEGQRVMIAMMLMAEPAVLIADEPTSALDVTLRGQVLSLLDELAAKRGRGLLIISHDLSLVASFCDRILVMYAGRIVESLRGNEIADAKHPYTRALWAARPSLDKPVSVLPTIPRDPAWANSGADPGANP